MQRKVSPSGTTRKRRGRKCCASCKTQLRLKRYPQRIECFDISMIHGAHAVGSMVTFVDGEPDKNLYRHFRIKTIDASSGGDDFGMMLEMLKRRFTRGKKKPICRT